MKSLKIWIALFVASAAFGYVLHVAGFPASFLIGPMIVAMLFAVRGANLAVPRPYLLGSQAIVGCLVARALDPSILSTIAVDWPAMLLVVATTVVASTFAGWMIARTGLLPGTTAAWGCSPGAATGMVAMAEEFGADPRLVAFMQFLRVVMVMIVATLVSRFVFGVTATEHAAAEVVVTFADQLPDLLKTLGGGGVGCTRGAAVESAVRGSVCAADPCGHVTGFWLSDDYAAALVADDGVRHYRPLGRAALYKGNSALCVPRLAGNADRDDNADPAVLRLSGDVVVAGRH